MLEQSRSGDKFLRLVDSLVTFAAITKGRSGSSRLKRIILKCKAVVLAVRFAPYIAYVRTHVNPAAGRRVGLSLANYCQNLIALRGSALGHNDTA